MSVEWRDSQCGLRESQRDCRASSTRESSSLSLLLRPRIYVLLGLCGTGWAQGTCTCHSSLGLHATLPPRQRVPRRDPLVSSRGMDGNSTCGCAALGKLWHTRAWNRVSRHNANRSRSSTHVGDWVRAGGRLIKAIGRRLRE